ncbi:MAG: HEAT repeat domain-containing protein [Syntrophaceae bacterium]|nr:HEAT repeat domain-containing protein [Syntrophaceae bacterium]
MADADLQGKALDVLFNVYTSIKNVQLHGSESPMVTNSIEKLYMHLDEILRQDSPLIFAESEKKALLCGTLLDENEQKTVHVSSLLGILRDFGIQSISFDKGMQREELNTFIKLLAKNPKAVHFDGGLLKLMKDNRISHISADKKEHILEGKNQETSPANYEDKSSESHVSSEEDPLSKSIAGMIDMLTRRDKTDTSIESFPSPQQKDLLNELSGQVIEWLKLDNAFTPDYRKICLNIEKLLQELFKKKLFAEVIPIMDILVNINSGLLPKENKVREVSLEVLQNLSTENNINVLFKELHTNENNKKVEANHILSQLGHILINKILDTIRDSGDSKERVRMIHLLIEEFGQRAIPVIKERINPNAAWYFLRNLAYIIGRIGDETSVDILQPLLLNKDKRIYIEAFKSAIQIGGNKKGSLLLSILPLADHEFRLNIIEMLGKIKYAEAVPDLLDILESKVLQAKDDQLSLQEKACNALGAIGSPEAIPVLAEITESKSFLGIKSYPTEVKYAAKRALASIERKMEESVEK